MCGVTLSPVSNGLNSTQFVAQPVEGPDESLPFLTGLTIKPKLTGRWAPISRKFLLLGHFGRAFLPEVARIR